MSKLYLSDLEWLRHMLHSKLTQQVGIDYEYDILTRLDEEIAERKAAYGLEVEQ